MVKRIAAFLLAVLLVPAAALTELKWTGDTPALKELKAYIEKVNGLLQDKGEMPVNSLFSCFPALAVMGITAEDDAEISETVEITVNLYYDTIDRIELRVSDADRFPVIAAVLIRALYGDAKSWEDALYLPAERAKKAKQNPDSSFEEPAEEMNGDVPRVYFAYYPNQYRDGVNWLQMTLVFPAAGEWNGESSLGIAEENQGTGLPEDADPDYEGYWSKDDYTHLEVFETATPEPDSAAAEYDFR